MQLETISITPDWEIELEIPECELGMADCTKVSEFGIRVHSCAFHFACENCARNFRNNIRTGFHKFKRMRCKKCHIGYSKNRYYQVVEL